MCSVWINWKHDHALYFSCLSSEGFVLLLANTSSHKKHCGRFLLLKVNLYLIWLMKYFYFKAIPWKKNSCQTGAFLLTSQKHASREIGHNNAAFNLTHKWDVAFISYFNLQSIYKLGGNKWKLVVFSSLHQKLMNLQQTRQLQTVIWMIFNVNVPSIYLYKTVINVSAWWLISFKK